MEAKCDCCGRTTRVWADRRYKVTDRLKELGWFSASNFWKDALCPDCVNGQ